MSSSFSRQFALAAGMVLLAIALIGLSFTSLIYSYILREKRAALSTNAGTVASYVGSLSSLEELEDWDIMLSISYGASASGTDVLILDTEGEIALCTKGQLGSEYLGNYVDTSLLESVEREGNAYVTGTLDGMFEEERYCYAVPLYSKETGLQMGYVIVAAEKEDTTNMMEKFVTLFLLTAAVVLLITLLTTWMLSRRQTETIREIAAAARSFAHGDFSARIDPTDADEEVSDLAMAFNNMATSLEKSEDLRQEFISNVSHELKTPMTSIAGFMDGMLDGTIPPERYAYYMQTVSDEVKRLNRLVRSMLEISRLSATKETISKSRFDITEALGRTLLSFEQKIEAKNLNVQVNMPDRAVYVMANEDSITQVIYNLIDNGVKFADPGTPFLLKVEPAGKKVLISVADTGPQIPQEELPLVFDRFHKSDKSRSEDTSGVGLGLYIVKTIIGSHGEDITVTSVDGVTTFTFTLPQVK